MQVYLRKKKNRFKKFIISMISVIIIGFISFELYKMYMNINVSQNNKEDKKSGIEIERTSETVDMINEKSRKISDVIEEVTQSVVGISKIKNNGSSIFLKDSAKQLGLGTGFIVSENGYIVTNEHVSGSKYSNCYVTLENGKTYNANVVWSDSDIDLSIIKINMKGLKFVNLGNSEEVRVGQSVYAIGNPIGFEFQRTVTSGIISALERTIKFQEDGKETFMSDLMQTDATINPGNSGGPLINSNGDVIAINSVKITSAEGIGFAIPINIIKPIIEKYISTGNFEESSIGIFAYDKEVVPYLDSNLKFNNGIYVAQLLENSPAEKAGIKIGDIIIKIDEKELSKMSDLREYIYTKNPNDEVILSIQRNGIQSDIKLKLGKK